MFDKDQVYRIVRFISHDQTCENFNEITDRHAYCAFAEKKSLHYFPISSQLARVAFLLKDTEKTSGQEHMLNRTIVETAILEDQKQKPYLYPFAKKQTTYPWEDVILNACIEAAQVKLNTKVYEPIYKGTGVTKLVRQYNGGSLLWMVSFTAKILDKKNSINHFECRYFYNLKDPIFLDMRIHSEGIDLISFDYNFGDGYSSNEIYNQLPKSVLGPAYKAAMEKIAEFPWNEDK